MKAFEPPSPKKKQEFLYNLNYPKTRWQDFMFSQFGSIRKKVWIVSALLFGVVMLFGCFLPKEDIRLLWAVSSIIPYVAFMTTTEIARSAIFGMAELEMTMRYHLRSVVLARMGILGLGNLVLLLITTPVLVRYVDLGYLQIGVFLLVPYLLTSFLSFLFVNRYRSGDVSYYCAGAAVFVSGLELTLSSIWTATLQQQYFWQWLVVLILLLTAVCREIRKLTKWEELIWNSYLTD
jgi:hypothetical protein